MSVILEADFTLSVAGRLHNPPAGQQFGSQGVAWTERGVAYLQRFRPGKHVHIGCDLPIPGNHAKVDVSMRLPALVPLEGGYLQLLQLTPSDGELASQVVEVRLDVRRRLTLAVFQSKDAGEVLLEAAPIGEWFDLSFAIEPVPAGKLRNPRQTLGGTAGTLAPWIQEVRSWTITT